ncbi:hypothetical protein FBQ85_03075 [Cytophagia bacterium CHB2]|nr:hypothetical protein [Cytophagia bacterium CHB2]
MNFIADGAEKYTKFHNKKSTTFHFMACAESFLAAVNLLTLFYKREVRAWRGLKIRYSDVKLLHHGSSALGPGDKNFTGWVVSIRWRHF